MAQGKFGARPAKVSPVSPAVIVFGLFFIVCSVVGIALLMMSAGKEEVQEVASPVAPVEQAVEIINVLVPIRTIQEGTRLEPALFTVKQVAKSSVSAKVITNFDRLGGMFSKTLIIADQPLHEDFITSVQPNSQISAKIPEGYRAVTIRVDSTSSVEGWARPGSKVDVLWITTEGTERLAKVIVENAQILSAEGNVNSDTNSKDNQALPSTVTLLVTSRDATKINLAVTTGRLSLMLRGDDDNQPLQDKSETTINTMIGGKAGEEDNYLKKGVIRIRKPNGADEEFVLGEMGQLVPLSSIRNKTKVVDE
jgi:pilus assembly protein CpaB